MVADAMSKGMEASGGGAFDAAASERGERRKARARKKQRHRWRMRESRGTSEHC